MKIHKFKNVCAALLFSSLVSFAGAQELTDFKQDVKDLKQLLDVAVQQYENGEAKAARKSLQNGYLTVFEGMEPAIRMYVSPRKNIEMEKELSVRMRRSIKNKVTAEEFKAQVDAFKTELDLVLPQIQGKNPLKAEAANDAASGTDVAVEWQEVFTKTEDGLAEALIAYRGNNATAAAKTVKDVQFKYFKSSGLETSIRRHRSSKDASEINSQFSGLIQSIKDTKAVHEVSYKITNLLQDLSEMLPQLPVHEKKSAAVKQ